MKIARVFPSRTSMSPIDKDAYYGKPQWFMPKYDEVHVSVTFTWDIKEGHELKYQWETVCDNVKIGGCAFNDTGNEFIAGRYLKKGCVITSRGCPNNCDPCFVPKREGKLRELPIVEGNTIQDNNWLACSKIHKGKTIEMLKHQKGICFKGGFESRKVDDKIVEDLSGLSIKEIWLACDYPNAFKDLKKAIYKLKKYFNINKLRCYVLIGKDMKEEEERMINIYKLDCLPFAQLYQGEKKKEYSKEWNRFSRKWSRPALYKNYIKRMGF